MARFIYYNQNPDGEKESDCVTRAISLATGLDYVNVRRKLYHTAKLNNCSKLCICCYRLLLENVLWLKPVYCENMTINEFADMHPSGTYLLRVDGHLTCLIDGAIYDIWDCRREELTDAWLVN